MGVTTTAGYSSVARAARDGKDCGASTHRGQMAIVGGPPVCQTCRRGCVRLLEEGCGRGWMCTAWVEELRRDKVGREFIMAIDLEIQWCKIWICRKGNPKTIW